MSELLHSLLHREPFRCTCGRIHAARLKDAVIRENALSDTARILRGLGGAYPYIIADENTFAAAGEPLTGSLREAGVGYALFLYPGERTEPDEAMVGAAVLHLPPECDSLIALGSGVINDITKILARMTGFPFICAATAPSMDGFASSTSSVIRDGLKVSVDSRCPDAVIGDLNVLCRAPSEMLQAGLGDMLAKYVSVCEWRIGHIVTGEYYCEAVAELVRTALAQCTDHAAGLARREPGAVRAVMEGLILSGVAADWAGVSRPVSGVEHYFSHIWDMRALEFGSPFSLHGIQCGIGTLYALAGYEALRGLKPDLARARAHAAGFDFAAWQEALRAFLGRAAETMIEAERRDGRNDPAGIAERQDRILAQWDAILRVIDEELPPRALVLGILREIGAPATPEEIGLPSSEIPQVFRMTRDVRDKYILSSLCFDLGCDEAVAETLV